MEMEANKLPWWSVYGPFPTGKGNMPHFGRVITAYREMKGWSAERLGVELGIKERRVYQLEGEMTLPDSLSRREMLMHTLSIPPALLGLLTLDDMSGQKSVFPNFSQPNTLPASTVEAYEGVLSLAWEAYYTSSAQQSSSTVNLWLQHLMHSLDTARGTAKDQVKALLCRFYQLSGVIARDRLDLDMSIDQLSKALSFAIDVHNAELVASSLYRRARTYVEMKNYDQVVEDLERALPYANRSRDPLRCYTTICLAEAYSLWKPKDADVQQKSINLLDGVGKSVRAHGVLQGDGSFAKVDVSGLYMVRGDVLRRFGKFDEARDAFSIVDDNLPKNFTRWHGNLLVSEAMLYCSERDIAGCCDMAIDALDIVDETHSTSTRTKIERLYKALVKSNPRHPDVLNLGKRLGVID